ncbi:MAG: hypothetical protein PHX07_07645 [Candidatus Marinimicrobia bacterium]|jgi:hypothetical protein|nr:hypothetical protein [Candidatus Neomarinimicrobiota bacterium]MDD4962095.1 hypothetical protein [Candidatus Neomarinimicrobiota bacterium]MDD5709111.1 hypothetical protein [Candidatus Neomarinimicrobiota bacterium]MDX9778016.1 hypothetical protein [bacterium]
MQHHSLIKFEALLKKTLDEIDHILEERYGERYDLHPARRSHGSTSNRSHDGLFDIRGEFTLGLGSKKGRGYIVDIDLKTLEKVPSNIIEEIEEAAIAELRKRLPKVFPGRRLDVKRDGNMIKIIGDLSLGSIG